MPATKPTPLSFLLSRLKANPKADYASLKAGAEKQKLKVWPIMYGRAKALLGLVPSAKRGQGRAAKASKAPGKRGRSVSADSKSAKIRELLSSGASAAEIAKQVGASANLVYAVRSKMGMTGKRGPGRPQKAKLPVRRGPGRPRKAAGMDGLDGLVTAIREQTRQAQQLRATLEKVRELVAGALG
jgi:transposase-like protein